MKYGKQPEVIGVFNVACEEMMFYQYLPVKLSGYSKIVMEQRLSVFDAIIGAACCDFVGTFGLDRFVQSNVYVTAKRMYQAPGTSFNRLGFHSDGFMTDDINYTWCDSYPTVFNYSPFELTMDDSLSLDEMRMQAQPENDVTHPVKTLLRLDQFNIHRVADITEGCFRAFFKISFSADKYDLIGNSHNYLLSYGWSMKPRKEARNIPQSAINNHYLR